MAELGPCAVLDYGLDQCSRLGMYYTANKEKVIDERLANMSRLHSLLRPVFWRVNSFLE